MQHHHQFSTLSTPPSPKKKKKTKRTQENPKTACLLALLEMSWQDFQSKSMSTVRQPYPQIINPFTPLSMHGPFLQLNSLFTEVVMQTWTDCCDWWFCHHLCLVNAKCQILMLKWSSPSSQILFELQLISKPKHPRIALGKFRWNSS